MGRHSADGPSAPWGEQPSGRDAYGDYETDEQDVVSPGGAPAAPPGSRRRMAIAAGVALLGVILLVFGLVSLLSTNDDPGTTAQNSATGTTVLATTSPTADTTTFTSTTPPESVFLPVTVLNNSPELTAGLATRVAAALEAGGWPIVELINYDATQLEETTAFFTPGNAEEEAAARALVAQFPDISGGAQPRFDGLAGTGLTVAAVGDWLP